MFIFYLRSSSCQNPPSFLQKFFLQPYEKLFPVAHPPPTQLAFQITSEEQVVFKIAINPKIYGIIIPIINIPHPRPVLLPS